jgi:hypothetical protein
MVTVIQKTRMRQDEEEALKRVLEYLAHEREDFLSASFIERERHIFKDALTLRRMLLGEEIVELGRCVCTPGAKEAMHEAAQQPHVFLDRHRGGDWGEVCRDDWEENDLCLREGFRLHSAYRTAHGIRLWVITEADRSVTTILLPEEY